MGTPTNFPDGLVIGGAPVIPGGGDLPLAGTYFYVDSVAGSDGYLGTWDNPFATLDYAIGRCTANKGDTIVCKQNHAETLTAAGSVTADIAGINIVGLGVGSDRPEFTFGTATSASFLITAANVSVSNIVGITGFDGLTNPFHVQAAGCSLNIEWQDPSSALQAVRAVLTTAAGDNLTLALKVRGQTSGGTAPVNAVRLVGCNTGRIFADFYGRASTSFVEFVTTVCTNIEVSGYMFNSGTTDGSKDVVDTVTGSTWFASFYDGAAGAQVSGGSAAAISIDDFTTGATVATADGTANSYSRDVIGNKTDATITAVGTTKSLMAYLKGVISWLTVAGTDSAANASVADVLGSKADTAVYVPGATVSQTAYLKGHAALQERVALSATAVMVNGNTIFTVAGGPIEIIALVSVCVTGNGATASTLQYSVTPTIGAGAQTISAASASLANATAGGSVTLAGTALATAALYSANGPNLIANPGTIYCPAGTITVVIGVGSTTGTWQHFIRYKPLAVGVTVS